MGLDSLFDSIPRGMASENSAATSVNSLPVNFVRNSETAFAAAIARSKTVCGEATNKPPAKGTAISWRVFVGEIMTTSTLSSVFDSEAWKY